MAELLGRDPWDDPYGAYRDVYKALDMDWVTALPNEESLKLSGMEAPRIDSKTFETASSVELKNGGRATEWGLSGSFWREEIHFATVDDVLAYDPLVNQPEVDLVSVKSQPRWYQWILDQQRDMGDSAVVSGLYYTTLFQCGIMAFGWPLFLAAAASEPRRFQRLLEGFAELARRNLTEYAELNLPLLLVHDDIAMQSGMVFRPEWYRQHIFPLYEQILDPLFSSPAVKVCFVSDGDYTPVLPDLVSLGFDGFIINPVMNLGESARLYGRDHFLVGNVDTAVLTLGDPGDVRQAVSCCVEEGKPCAGHFIKAGGELPHNIPLENINYVSGY